MKIEVVKCCLTCIRSHFEIIAQKKNNKISTGFCSNGLCYNRKVKSIKIYYSCNKYKKRDDIFSAEKLKLNKEEKR